MAGETEIGALIVAAISVATGPITARLAYGWSRKQDSDKWERERIAEKTRWDREDELRRKERGEKAALEILTLVSKARMMWALPSNQTDVKQADFASTYQDIRRLANELADEEVYARVLEVAEAIFYYPLATAAEQITEWEISRDYEHAADQVLRAYLQGRPCPATPALARLVQLIDQGQAIIEAQTAEGAALPVTDQITGAPAPASDQPE